MRGWVDTVLLGVKDPIVDLVARSLVSTEDPQPMRTVLLLQDPRDLLHDTKAGPAPLDEGH